MLAPVYLEGTYSEVYPNKAEDEEGMRQFFKEFSFPGGIGSHCTPETPGSIHEGGELGYSVSHAFGAAFDNPDLLVAVVVGDGEAETGPLATSWHSNKFLNPVRDGAVLPILHLNGYKINNPTLLSRIPREELEALFKGYGWTPHFAEGDDPARMHQTWPQRSRIACWRSGGSRTRRERTARPRGPTGDDRAAHCRRVDRPKEVDGHKVEASGALTRFPCSGMHENPATGPTRRVAAQLSSRDAVDAHGATDPGTEALAPKERAA